MDVAAYLSILRRRWYVLLLLVVAGLLGGRAYGEAQPRVYTATSQSFVSVPAGDANNLTSSLQGSYLSSNFVQTYAKIVTTRSLGQQVAQTLHLPYDGGGVAARLHTSVITNTLIIDITASDSDPQRAAAIANAAADALHTESQSLSSSSTQVIAQTIDRAVAPSVPVSPHPSTDMFLGLVFGLILALGLIALLEALDRTVTSSAQAATLVDAPLLGMLPRRRGGLTAATQDAQHDVAAEAYRSLRTAVRFLNPDSPLRTILITSASPSDGKTTTAGNLAISLARGGERVIAVDCDLRRAGLADFFGVESAVGVTSVLRREVALRDALQPWAPNLRVLAAGPLPPNPAELLGSQAMASLLDRLAIDADVVVIDAPPCLPVTDAVVLGTQVDGVLLVARHGKTLRGALSESRRRLEAVGASVAGVVLNGMPMSEAREYYVEYVYKEVPLPKRSRPRPSPDTDPEPDEVERPVGSSR